MNMNKILAAGLIAAVASTASFAESGNGGFYVGANFGLAFNKTKIKTSGHTYATGDKLYGQNVGDSNKDKAITKASTEIASSAKQNKKKTKFMAELALGYDFRLGDVMMGVDLTFGTMFGKQNLRAKSQSATAADPSVPTAHDSVSVLKLKQQWAIGLMPRIGYLFTPEFEGYVTAGIKFAKWKAKTIKSAVTDIKSDTYTTAAITEDVFNKSVNKSKMKVQPVIGAGVRYEFMPSMFAKLEYNFEFKAKPKMHSDTMPELKKIETKAHVFKLLKI